MCRKEVLKVVTIMIDPIFVIVAPAEAHRKVTESTRRLTPADGSAESLTSLLFTPLTSSLTFLLRPLSSAFSLPFPEFTSRI